MSPDHMFMVMFIAKNKNSEIQLWVKCGHNSAHLHRVLPTVVHTKSDINSWVNNEVGAARSGCEYQIAGITKVTEAGHEFPSNPQKVIGAGTNQLLDSTFVNIQ